MQMRLVTRGNLKSGRIHFQKVTRPEKIAQAGLDRIAPQEEGASIGMATGPPPLRMGYGR
jgi:hypothetical protein